MANIIVFSIIILIIGISLSKVIREKKRNKCVGCPLSGSAKGSGCSCS